MSALDAATTQLVRFAAAIAAGSEGEMRVAVANAVAAGLDPVWVEEIILQTYLFAGFPRALNAAREWRKASGRAAPRSDAGEDYREAERWARRGDTTCALVYGDSYERLRANIRDHHPALDSWMIVEGYGKVLSRPGLDLARRELCIVASCAALGQDRQLHAHMRGALNAGCKATEVEGALDEIAPLVADDDMRRFRQLLARVRGK